MTIILIIVALFCAAMWWGAHARAADLQRALNITDDRAKSLQRQLDALKQRTW